MSGGDADGDGLPDDYELRYWGDPSSTNDAAGDYDEDGYSNGDEYVADTSPTNGSSFFDNLITNAVAAGQTMDLIAGPPTTNSRIYDAFSSVDLVSGIWAACGLDVPGASNGSAVILTVTNNLQGRFYRTGVKIP